MVTSLRFISIICAALVAGLTVTHVLEMPGKRTLDGAQWLAVQHTFYGGFAVVGGIGEVLGLVATGALVVLTRQRRATAVLTGVAALSFLGMLLSYALGNRPINDLVATWTPATLPA